MINMIHAILTGIKKSENLSVTDSDLSLLFVTEKAVEDRSNLCLFPGHGSRTSPKTVHGDFTKLAWLWIHTFWRRGNASFQFFFLSPRDFNSAEDGNEKWQVPPNSTSSRKLAWRNIFTLCCQRVGIRCGDIAHCFLIVVPFVWFALPMLRITNVTRSSLASAVRARGLRDAREFSWSVCEAQATF